MGRYANASLTINFPDLSEGDDLIYVTMRNPKTVPLDQLVPGDVPTDENGEPDREALTDATYAILAGLVTDWHVYDGTTDEDSPALELPATVELVRKLPMEILNGLMTEVGKVTANPQ